MSSTALAPVAVLVAAAPAISGQATCRPVASAEPGWPQFRGPRRDGVCGETGLLKAWPKEGPKLAWKAEGLGRGYSSAVVTHGTVYVTGDVGDELVVYAFDLAGELRWKTTNGRAWKGPYPGARSSVTYELGRLYHMNAHGRAGALDAADGREIWAVEVLRRFGAKNIRWGLSECLLVHDGRVIVTPGGPKALVAALDAETGRTAWAGEPLRFTRTRRFGGDAVDPPAKDTDKAGYASPIMIDLASDAGARRVIAGASARHYFIVDAATGEILWTHEVPARYEVIGAIPVLHGDGVLFTAPRVPGRSLRVRADGDGVRLEEAWQTRVDNCHGSLVAVGERILGSGYEHFKGWGAIDAATGEMLYTTRDAKRGPASGGADGALRELANGSAVWSDGRLYALSETGTAALLAPGAAGFECAGSFRLPSSTSGKRRRRDVWAHPTVADGRLYLRDHGTLYCYAIGEQ